MLFITLVQYLPQSFTYLSNNYKKYHILVCMTKIYIFNLFLDETNIQNHCYRIQLFVKLNLAFVTTSPSIPYSKNTGASQ